MDSDTFINSTIYIHFRNEYYSNNNNLFKNNIWNNFIESKDLGVICLSHFNDEYKIVDEKKWMLTKIKYGF